MNLPFSAIDFDTLIKWTERVDALSYLHRSHMISRLCDSLPQLLNMHACITLDTEDGVSDNLSSMSCQHECSIESILHSHDRFAEWNRSSKSQIRCPVHHVIDMTCEIGETLLSSLKVIQNFTVAQCNLLKHLFDGI